MPLAVGDHDAIQALGDRADFGSGRNGRTRGTAGRCPAVRVRNSVWKPIRPRAGIMYSRRTRPLPSGSMFLSWPLRDAQALHHAALEIALRCRRRAVRSAPCVLAVDFLDDDFGARHGQLVAFATHGFDQHRQMQFAAARHLELVGSSVVFDAQRDVVQRLAHQALAHLAAGQELATAGPCRRRTASC